MSSDDDLDDLVLQNILASKGGSSGGGAAAPPPPAAAPAASSATAGGGGKPGMTIDDSDDEDEELLQQILAGKDKQPPPAAAAAPALAAPPPAKAAAPAAQPQPPAAAAPAPTPPTKTSTVAPAPQSSAARAAANPRADRDSPDSDDLLDAVLGTGGSGAASKPPERASEPPAPAPAPAAATAAKPATQPATAAKAEPAAPPATAASTTEQPDAAPAPAPAPAPKTPPPPSTAAPRPAEETAVRGRTRSEATTAKPPSLVAAEVPAPAVTSATDAASPTVEQLVDDARRSADPQPSDTAAAGAEDEDDEAAERILQQLLQNAKDNDDADDDEDEADDADALAAAAGSAAASPGNARGDDAFKDIFTAAAATESGNELSLKGESEVLQAIIDALKGGSSEDEDEHADIMAALRQAERVAAAGVSNLARGQSVLRMHEVQGLADQFKRARTTVGTPTCMSAAARGSATAFAVGTTVGFAMLFDARCKLLGVCGGAGHDDARGSCTSIALNCDGTLLVTGHDRGAMAVWDTETLQPVKVITDELSEPVFKAAFLHPDPLKCLMMDATGVVAILSCSRVMKSLMVRVVNIDAELTTPMASDAASTCVTVTNPETHETKEVHYLAVVCSEEAVVFKVSFGITTSDDCIARLTPSSRETNNATEVVAWIQRPSGPCLCVCWGQKVDFFQLTANDDLVPVGNVMLPTVTNSVGVLDGGCLLLGDQDRNVHVVDTSVGVDVEILQLFSVEPVEFSHRSCGIKHQGGFCCVDGIVYILGAHRALACSIVPWEARLDTLVGFKDWTAALDLARGFANETALAVVGLSNTPTVRRRTLTQYIVTLLTSYIADVMRKKPEPSVVCELMDTIINFCQEIESLETLFGPVACFFESLNNGPRFAAATLAALGSRRLTSVPSAFLPTLIDFAKSGTDFAELTGQPDDATSRHTYVEQALMHVENEDEALLAVGKDHGLWRLVCVVWTVRLGRPESSVTDLCGIADEALADFISKLFNGQSLLAGEAFSADKRATYTIRVLNALLEHPQALLRVASAAAGDLLDAIGVIAEDKKLWFPHSDVKKTTLMQRLWQAVCLPASDAKRPWLMEKHTTPLAAQVRCLSMICRGVSNKEITFDAKTLGVFVEQASFALAFAHDRHSNLAQRVHIQRDLSALFEDQNAAGASNAGVEQELTSKKLVRSLASLRSTKKHFGQAIALFTEADPQTIANDPSLREEVFDFLGSLLERFSGDKWRLPTIKMAIKERLGDLFAVDPTRLARFVFNHLPQDKEEIIRLLVSSGEHSDAKAQYLFMGEMFNSGKAVPSREELTDYIMLRCQFEPETVYDYLVGLGDAEFEMSDVLDACRQLGIANACIYLYEKALMIPQAMSLLNETLHDGLVAAREVIVDMSGAGDDVNSNDGQQLTSSFAHDSMLLTDATSVVRQIENAEDAMGQIEPAFPAEAHVLDTVNVGMSMCKRYAKVVDESELPKIWFSLLDSFAKPKQILAERLNQSRSFDAGMTSHEQQRTRRNTMRNRPSASGAPLVGEGAQVIDEIDVAVNDMRVAPLTEPLKANARELHEALVVFYSKYVSYILSNMVQALELSVVVNKIILDNERESFGPFKPILVGILQKLTFNLHANQISRDCTNDDVFALHDKLRRTVSMAVTPQSSSCHLCGQHFSVRVDDHDTLRFFRCGHGFHDVCLKQQSECPVCALEARFGAAAATMFSPSQKAGSPAVAGQAGGASGKRASSSPAKAKAAANVDASASTDIPTMLRRMRRTSMKIEGNRNFNEILDGLLAKDARSRLRDSSKVASASARGLVLAPAPPQPVIPELFTGRLATIADSTIKQHFTADDVQDIFGTDEPYDLDAVLAEDEEEDQRVLADVMGGGGGGAESADGHHIPEEDKDELDW